MTGSWLLAFLLAQATPQSAPANDWASYNRTPASDRFSPLTQITPENVSRLRQVCMYDSKEQVSFQTGPLVVNGVMYFTTDTMTYAIDAATCALKWRQRTPLKPTYLQVNRGVAYQNGRLFRGAGEGYLLALDAATGRTVWNVPLGQLQPGESAPMAPLAWNGLVFIGNAGGDSHSVTGRVLAIDQRDGRIVWTFEAVPDTGKIRDTWHNAPDVPPTGGAFWTSFALDTAQRVLYVPAGNPAPDFIPELRPGSNLLTNSVIALDVCYNVQQAPIASMKQMKPGDPWGGDVGGGFGTPDSASKAQGWITAVDADSGTVRWQVRTPRPLLAGITPTAGGVVFTGELSGDVIALNPQTGAVLWRQSTGNSIGGGVITYQVRGKQFVAVAAGMKSAIWPTVVQSNRIVVFGLP
ncbi:MAG TPA: PQQ-binding-like beta-propeller repeat protein [Gemmatimonadales bacterium]|nr:PQQ-binding-like beta-propeller repeat protein [Gemmatimonadales bacterium]